MTMAMSTSVVANRDPNCFDAGIDANGGSYRVCEGTEIDHLPGSTPAAEPSGGGSRSAGPTVPMKAVGTLGEDEHGNPCVATTFIPWSRKLRPSPT